MLTTHQKLDILYILVYTIVDNYCVEWFNWCSVLEILFPIQELDAIDRYQSFNSENWIDRQNILTDYWYMFYI